MIAVYCGCGAAMENTDAARSAVVYDADGKTVALTAVDLWLCPSCGSGVSVGFADRLTTDDAHGFYDKVHRALRNDPVHVHH